jgi:heterodisulfide reductase subunit A
MSSNKAIHIYFSQAIPLITYIDESCLYLKEKKCAICRSVCKNDAIDFTQRHQKIVIHVGAVLLAPGFEPFDPSIKPEYGYGRYANVVTSLDYERLLCATGPFEGEILRPSDKRHPHNIAWFQCIGSRRVTPEDNSYCSAVCCTYTQKQVILTKDHDPEARCTIFHNDVRAYGKDFERFFQRASQLLEVRFIRSYASIVREIPETQDIVVRYYDPALGVIEEVFDMVVLSIGLNPPKDAQALARIFGIELNEHRFCRIDSRNPMESSRKGIFVSGAFQGPMDIPEAVLTASGAGSQCGQLLGRRRGKLTRERKYPQERDTSTETPRVGVFVCHCGANIGRIVNIPETVAYAKKLPHVVHAEEGLFICSTEAAQRIANSIREKGLNRVVVAACTPRTHEPLFRDTLREGGINQYLFDFANIREHCSWVHSKEKEKATIKAKDLIRMSVARSLLLEPLQESYLPVNPAALVIGGGVAGMTAALSIAGQGHEVYLIEKEEELGGMVKRLHYTLEGMDVQAHLHELIRKIYAHPLIHVYHQATVTQVDGYIGNFVTTVKSDRGETAIKHGAAVLAIGADVYTPTEYLYGQHDSVVTQLELEDRIAKRDPKVVNARNLVMIQCVGCRNQERNYCSRICCSESVKNALELKKSNPKMNIYVLYRDIRTYGFNEDYYREARGKSVRFIRYIPDEQPVVEATGNGSLRVTLTDQTLQKKVSIDADVLSLAAAVIPSKSIKEIAGLFKVTLSPDGYFQEAHVKLRPVDFSAEGVFVCGSAHYPKHVPETINQAYGAAGRTLTLLSHETVVASGSVCDVDPKKCIGCGTCIPACRYGAISFRQTRQGQKAEVNPVLCKGDGLCNAKCPTGAIFLKHYTDQQVFCQIDALFLEEWN